MIWNERFAHDSLSHDLESHYFSIVDRTNIAILRYWCDNSIPRFTPKTQVVFYQESDGDVPVLDWLKTLLKSDRKGYAKCIARIQQLADTGHELRRPAADYLRDDIYELRAKQINIQYRILYFFQGQNIAILAHAIVKDSAAAPNIDIERAITRKRQLEKDSTLHTYSTETD